MRKKVMRLIDPYASEKERKVSETIALLTPKEAAKILHISVEQLKVMRRKNIGPIWYKLSPKIIRYDIDTLREWLKGKASLRREGLVERLGAIIEEYKFPG